MTTKYEIVECDNGYMLSFEDEPDEDGTIQVRCLLFTFDKLSEEDLHDFKEIKDKPEDLDKFKEQCCLRDLFLELLDRFGYCSGKYDKTQLKIEVVKR